MRCGRKQLDQQVKFGEGTERPIMELPPSFLSSRLHEDGTSEFFLWLLGEIQFEGYILLNQLNEYLNTVS